MTKHKQLYLSKSIRDKLYNRYYNANAAHAATAAYTAATAATVATAAYYATAANATSTNSNRYYFWRNEVFQHLNLILCQIAIRDEIKAVQINNI